MLQGPAHRRNFVLAVHFCLGGQELETRCPTLLPRCRPASLRDDVRVLVPVMLGVWFVLVRLTPF